MNNTFSYELINQYEGTMSPTGTVQNDYATAYFTRCLWQRMLSVIGFTLLDGWNASYFKSVLFRDGFIGVIPTDNFGIIPQMCTLSGYGIWLQPTDVLVSQPLVKFSGKIGKNCGLIRLTPDYRGVWDIVNHYALMLSTAYTSVNVSLVNSRVSNVFGAKNKQAAETLKIIGEKISSGEPLVVFDKSALLGESMTGSDPIWTMNTSVKESYITDKLLADIATIMSMFDREIGIPNVNEKKERYIEEEVNVLTADSFARIGTWKECLTESINEVNSLFGLDISFTIRGGENNESSGETDTNRNV